LIIRSLVPLKITNGTAVVARATIFIPCQSAVASVCVGTGLIPSTEIAFSSAGPMFIPAMLPPLAPAVALELAAVVGVVLFALAQPATSATVAHASAPRPIVLLQMII
jgi:hypothetical protein